jgi:hypothetical protein
LERLRLVPFLLAVALFPLDLELDFLRLLTTLTTFSAFLALLKDLDLLRLLLEPVFLALEAVFDLLRLLTVLTTFLAFLALLKDLDFLLEPVFLALDLEADFDFLFLLTGAAFLDLDAVFLLRFLAPPTRAVFEPRFSNSLADIYNYKYTLYYFINKII